MYEEELVKKAGEKAIVEILKEKGYTDVDIIAMEKQGKIRVKIEKGELLIKVKSSIYPLDPGFLTGEELESIQKEAKEIGAKPRFARIWLNEDLTPKYRHPNWKKL